MCVFYGGLTLKEIEFCSNEINNIDEIAKELFINTDSKDPSSIYYKRNLVRPKINWFYILMQITTPTVICILITKLLVRIGVKFSFSITISCSALFIYILLRLKKILICLIHIYQHFAPESIRMKCRFEPSCSQYMIMSLDKYGVLKGLTTGIRRIRKCKIGNGGYDFP